MAPPSQRRATEPGPPGCSDRIGSPTPRSQRYVILPKGQRDLAVGLRPPLCRRAERQRSRRVDLHPCPRPGWLGSLSSEDGRVCSRQNGRRLSLSLSLSLSTGTGESSGPAAFPARERAPAVHGICLYPHTGMLHGARLYTRFPPAFGNEAE